MSVDLASPARDVPDRRAGTSHLEWFPSPRRVALVLISPLRETPVGAAMDGELAPAQPANGHGGVYV